jgi:hypothetical protein
MSTAADDRADREMGRPTMDDLEQENFAHPAVPVRITDPVTVQQLPVLAAQSRTFAVANGSTVKLLNTDNRRSRALFVCESAVCYVGTDQQGTATRTSAFRVPIDHVIELRSSEQWWIHAANADALVSVMAEQWAE